MYDRNEQLSIIESIRVAENTIKRIDCPFCGGRYTFTVSKQDGKLLWNCYKASCTTGGVHSVGRSIENIRSMLNGMEPQGIKNRVIPLPDIVSYIKNHAGALDYLKKVHAYEAWEKGLIQCVYAPAEDRVLFYMNKKQGAVGRSLSGAKPKWKAFGDTTGCFTCGTGTTAVVVEDAASASAVGILEGITGVALLGTNVNSLQKKHLRAYSKVIISLDKDASSKAIKLLTKLEGLVPTTVRFLEEDLKWLTGPELKELYNEGTCHSDRRL